MEWQRRGQCFLRKQNLGCTVGSSEFVRGHKEDTWRVLLLRRLWQPLPLVSRICRCGRPLDSSGHHRAACANSGVLGHRGFAVDSAVARVCREAEGRVSCNVSVRDLDVGVPVAGDGRRLEVVTDGLPLFHGARLALDATMVSALRCHGTPHRRAAEEDGAVCCAQLDAGRNARIPN